MTEVGSRCCLRQLSASAQRSHGGARCLQETLGLFGISIERPQPVGGIFHWTGLAGAGVLRTALDTHIGDPTRLVVTDNVSCAVARGLPARPRRPEVLRYPANLPAACWASFGVGAVEELLDLGLEPADPFDEPAVVVAVVVAVELVVVVAVEVLVVLPPPPFGPSIMAVPLHETSSTVELTATLRRQSMATSHD